MILYVVLPPPPPLPSVYLHEFFFSRLIFHPSIHFFPLYAERLKRSVGKYCERKDFESNRRVILMADTTPLDGGFVLHEGGGIPNDSLYQIVIRTPRNRQGSLNFGNLRARRKRSGRAMIEDDGRRGKKGVWKGGENELQKIVLVKYDDLHLSRYKEILWPSSRGFLFLPFLSSLLRCLSPSPFSFLFYSLSLFLLSLSLSFPPCSSFLLFHHHVL